MEILYVIAIVAVFVLCLALLSTARKILRSSPLSSGHLALSRIYDVERPGEESQEEERVERSVSGLDFKHAGSNHVVIDRVAIAEIAVPEAILANTIVAEPLLAVAMPKQSEIKDVSARPRMDKTARSRKPPRRVYNYALECLLIGVSAWVLVKTQRSTLRYSSRPSSRDRVA